VHRLDHRTSGALLFAFDSNTAGRLHAALGHADSEKGYIAVLRGNWYHSSSYNNNNNSTTTVVDHPIKVEDGTLKDARTTFQCLAVQDDGKTLPCSLVIAKPETGRQHQIRRHAFYMGMPILGDTQHGDSQVNRWWRTHQNLNRMMLHCFSINIPWDDSSSGWIDIVAPLDNNLREFLEQEALETLWNTACRKEPRLTNPFVDIRSGTLGIQKDWQKKREVENEIITKNGVNPSL
jgi:tRNA pseudouridine65 synthase